MMIDRESAEKLMSMFVKRSGYSRWHVVGKDGEMCLEFYDEKTGQHAFVCSNPEIAYVKMPSGDVVDVVSVLEKLSRRGCVLFIANGAVCWQDMKVVVLMEPRQNLEELLVKADLEDV